MKVQISVEVSGETLARCALLARRFNRDALEIFEVYAQTLVTEFTAEMIASANSALERQDRLQPRSTETRP